jgi:DNA-directed RNA polymerase subunit alpha
MFLSPEITRVDLLPETASYCKFEIEPLARGYGTTIGNALRRIMLMNLPGFAATSIKIDGINSEYDELSSTTESLLDITLNVKQVAATLCGDIKKKDVIIDVTGPCHVYANDIQDEDLIIENRGQKIMTVREGCHIYMEIRFEAGKGYGSAASRSDSEPGRLQIDSMFSPAKRVNYHVEPTRVGDCTDYDKLTIEVWTDGTKPAQEVLAWSANLLRENLLVFAGEHDPTLEEVPDEQ